MSVCVCVALVIPHANSMRRVILSRVACLFSPHFSTSSHARHNFRDGGGGGELLNTKCVF